MFFAGTVSPAYAFTTGEAASIVIGQTTFTADGSGTSSTTLNNPEGVAFDGKGNLWVADEINSRVLRFKPPFSNDEAASLVLGQTTFTGSSCTTTATGLCFSGWIAFSGGGNLWVTDLANSRVLMYSS